MIGINKLAHAYLQASPLRRRIIVLTITLSTILLFTIGGLSITQHIQRNIYYERLMGNFDGFYSQLNKRQTDEVIHNKDVETYGISYQLPSILMNDSETVTIKFGDEGYRKSFGYEIIQGQYPTKETEIALTKSAIAILNPSIKIGDTLRLNTQDGNDDKQTFQLTGIIEDRVYDNQRSIVFVSESYSKNMKKEQAKSTLFVTVINGLDKSAAMDKIREKAGIDSKQMRGKGRLDTTIEYIMVEILVVIICIIAVSNIFSYTIVDRVHNMGLLKAVGMTNKQMKHLFQKEGFYYYIKGTSLGLIIGISVHIFMLALMYDSGGYVYNNTMQLGEYIQIMLQTGVRNHYYTVLLVLTCILQIIAVWLAIKIPTRKVKKISIVGAIHFTSNITMKKAKRKRLKLKNPALKLAFVNLINNPLKTVLTVLIMSMSATIFLYFTSFIAITDSENMVRRWMIGDIMIWDNEYENLAFAEGIENVDNVYGRIGKIEKVSPHQLKINENYKERTEQLQSLIKNNEDADIQIFGYNEDMLELQFQYVDSDYTFDQLKTTKDWCLVYDRSHGKNYQVGDKLTINGSDLMIVGKISRVPYGWNDCIAPLIVVNMEFLAGGKGPYNRSIIGLKVDDSAYKQVKEQIQRKYQLDEEASVSYFDEEFENEKKTKSRMKWMLYLLVGIVGGISLLMLFNSMYTSIISRKRELGMLRAIGMTKEQFYQYLHFEGYILICLITFIGLPAGYLISLMSYKGFVSIPENAAFVFSFPLWSLSIFILYYLIMRFIIKMCIKRMEKEAVVELIRYV